MTTTTETTRPNIQEMYVVHRVFRREFAMLPRLVRQVRDGDTTRAELVGAHLQLILDGLHMHHTGEDDVLWPLLLERAAPSSELVHTMQAQHDRVDAQVERISPLLREWVRTASSVRGEQLARLVEEFREALLEHLDLEEREVLTLISQHITVAEWDSLGEHGKDAMSPRQLPLMFGCILEDASPEERTMMLRALPAPVRLLMRTWGVRHHRRYISRVRAA